MNTSPKKECGKCPLITTLELAIAVNKHLFKEKMKDKYKALLDLSLQKN